VWFDKSKRIFGLNRSVVFLENESVLFRIDTSAQDIQWNFVSKISNTTVVEWGPLPQLTGFKLCTLILKLWKEILIGF
jgi:hypothetical protein